MVARAIQSVIAKAVGGSPPPVLPTTDLLVALFADQGVTDDGAGEVTAWADQSGNGNDLVQADAAERPEVDATGGPEGGQCAAFGAQSADLTGHMDFASPITVSASKHTYYAVINIAAIASTQFLLFSNSAGKEAIVPVRAGADVAMFDGSGSYRMLGPATTGWQCLTFQSATTVCRAFRGRSQIGTDQPWAGDRALDGTFSLTLGAITGGVSPLDGRLAAVLIYDREHDATERAAVWDYLASLYPSVGL